MTDIIKAMNPAAPLTTEESALAAAKVGAVGLGLGAINQAVAGWYSSTPAAQQAAARMVEDLTGQVTEPAALAQQAQMGLVITGVVVLLHIGLAVVQWRKPNNIIPILFLVLSIWGLGGAVLGFAVKSFGAAQPLWLGILTIVLLGAAVVSYVASMRGVSALDKIRTQAAQDY